MSLAKTFQRQLHQQTKIHAAWLPVLNTFRVGTYGLMEGGVLRPLGHIADDFGVELGKLEKSPTGGATFESEGVVTTRTVANVEVPNFSGAGDGEAKLSYTFKRKDSVLFKAPELTLTQLPSIAAVANQLQQKLGVGWRRAYRVVSGVYSASSPLILLASEADTTISFEGKASALKQIEAASAAVEFETSASSERSFRVAGKAGIVGLGLFKLALFGGPSVLAKKASPTDAQFETGEAWTDIEDDL